MAFVVLSTSAKDAFEKSQAHADGLHRYCTNKRNAIAASGQTTKELVAIEDNLETQRANLIATRDVKGVVAYARNQIDDQVYAFKTELNSLVAAIDATLAELYKVIPKDADGNIKGDLRNPDNTKSPETVDKATLATLDTLLAGIIGAISKQ